MIKNVTDNHEIPNNWIWVDLEQLCDITSGNPAPQNKNFFKNGNVPFVRVQDMGRMGNNVYLRKTKDYLNNDAVAKNNMKLFSKGSVLFTKSGMSILLNQRAILGLDMHVVSHIGICLPTKFTLSEWIYYWLKSIDFKELTHATTLPSLKLSKVQKIRIPLPPLPEQHRIVAKIEGLLTKLDVGVEVLKQVQAQLQQYRQSVLKAAVEGSLTTEWREKHLDNLEPADKLLERIQKERKEKLGKKYKEPIPVDTSDLSELPEGWVWATWEQVLSNDKGSFKRGPFGSSLKKSMFVESGYKVYEQYCPINDDCSFARYYITKEKFLEMEGFSVRENDFLISCSGVTLGRITQVPNEYDEGIINQALLRVRINDCVVTSAFFIKLFRSPYFQKQIFAHSTGTAIPNVKGVKELKAIPVPLPSLLEQKIIISEIERLFSIIDESETMIEYELKRAQSLRQSILKRAFEGKLVPQESND